MSDVTLKTAIGAFTHVRTFHDGTTQWVRYFSEATRTHPEAEIPHLEVLVENRGRLQMWFHDAPRAMEILPCSMGTPINGAVWHSNIYQTIEEAVEEFQKWIDCLKISGRAAAQFEAEFPNPTEPKAWWDRLE